MHLRLNRPPLCQRGLVHQLDHGLPAPRRVEKVSERSDVGIEPPGIVPDPRICEGNSDLVVRPTRYEAFVHQASVGIEIDQITIIWYAARAEKRRQALVVRAGNAIEHLIDDAVEAQVSGVIERNARRQRVRERAAGIVEALISEARAGVVPGADSVRAGESFGVLTLVGLIAGFRDEEGAAAKAENGAGRKRPALIGIVRLWTRSFNLLISYCELRLFVQLWLRMPQLGAAPTDLGSSRVPTRCLHLGHFSDVAGLTHDVSSLGVKQTPSRDRGMTRMTNNGQPALVSVTDLCVAARQQPLRKVLPRRFSPHLRRFA